MARLKPTLLDSDWVLWTLCSCSAKGKGREALLRMALSDEPLSAVHLRSGTPVRFNITKFTRLMERELRRLLKEEARESVPNK